MGWAQATMHKLLLRQLQQHLGALDAMPRDWQAFIEAVNQAYQQADADHALLEHSLEVSSQELLERNHQLRHDLAERQQKEAALRQAEEERLQLQEEIIRMQAATLAQLSTPLIPISDHIMVMPLIGTLDSQRIQHVMEILLQGLAGRQTQVAILDITGVLVVDTQVAYGLIRAAHAGQLLGARIILTGIRPEVAQTLVGLGIDLGGIVTYSTLQHGITAALRQG
ncbi:MAG: STAS domain-containing protein [Roseiflexaceae bacterium]